MAACLYLVKEVQGETFRFSKNELGRDRKSYC